MEASLARNSKTRQLTWTRLSWASYLLNGFAAVLGGAVLPQVIRDFQLNPFLGGLFVALPAIGIILAGLAGGLLTSAIGNKRLLIMSMLGMAACLMIISFASVLSVLLLGALAFGLSNGMIETCGNSIIADVHHGSAARELNRLHLMFGIGAFISPLMVAFFLSLRLSWHVSYWLIAFLLIALSIIVRSQPALPYNPTMKINTKKMWAMFLHPVILQAWFGAILLLSTEQGITGWVTAYFRDVRVLPEELASLGLAIFWLFILFGRFLNTRLPVSLSPRKIILAEVLSSALILLVVLISRETITSLVGIAVFGACMAGLYPTLLAYATEQYPSDAGLVSGIFVTGVGLGKLFGPAAIGAIATNTSIPIAMFLTWFLLLCLAILFSFRVKRNYSENGGI